MGTIASSGIGSGLDVAALVDKLVQAEGQPKTLRLNTEEAKVQAKLSALGSLRSALAAFRDNLATLKDIAKFQGRKATLADATFVTATATKSATPGTYSIEVQQLASAHKLQSADFASADTVVGTGTLRITAGGENFDVEIAAGNDSLAGIADAINESAAGAKVAATVIAGNGIARLTITARSSGAANAITITQSGGDGGLASLVYPPSGSGLTELVPAADAEALIDGVAVTSATNTLSGAIAGVDVSLLAANAVGETTNVTIGYDTAAARKTIDGFVTSYNAVLDAIKSVASFNAETKESGPLFADAGVRNIVYQLRRQLTSNVNGLSGPYDMLGEIGITASLDGKLSVDGAALDAAFAADFDGVGELFAADDKGVAIKLDALLDPYLATNGVFDSRTVGLKSSIDGIADKREALNARLQALHDRYTKQFNALDTLLGQLQSTSNFLSQQLSQLPGSGVLLRNKG
jgi:flagellar hook-associated protein 2